MMKKNKDNTINRISAVVFFLLFIFTVNYAQQSEKIALPDLNIVPNGLAKASFQLHTEKRGKLQAETGRLTAEKTELNQRCKSFAPGSLKGKQCQTELALNTSKLNELIQQINVFNSEIEEVVFKDPALDKLSIITYYTLKKNPKLWDEFQKNVSAAKIKLAQEKVKIQQEVTKIRSKKQKIKIPFNEGVILSMCAGTYALEDSLKSPFTGVCYKSYTKADVEKILGSGVVFVSFGIPLNQNSNPEVARNFNEPAASESFSLASAEAKAALNELKEKQFNRLIAHSNGATVAECLLVDSLIEIKELNIIGGDKTLLNGQALQQLLNNGIVKRIVVWINLDDPKTWVTPVDKVKIIERTEKYISYKNKFKEEEVKPGDAKIEYKWILGNGNLNAIGAKDPLFIESYFKEISKEFSRK